MRGARKQQQTHTDEAHWQDPLTMSRRGKVHDLEAVGVSRRWGRYAFDLRVYYADGTTAIISFTYSALFGFQCLLLDAFPEEAGEVNGRRIIPTIPGKNIMYCGSRETLAWERLDPVREYFQQLVSLPPYISQSELVQRFLSTYTTYEVECPPPPRHRTRAPMEIILDGFVCLFDAFDCCLPSCCFAVEPELTDLNLRLTKQSEAEDDALLSPH